ncbi:MAG: hypothetical protein U5N21_17565 [Rhodococcus sp. (in: high G+C Gram-positive bacteria)]|nr:hypothetical protein [Rhodococcus sp. (in: high G+C Gram-positive bacteria)]
MNPTAERVVTIAHALCAAPRAAGTEREYPQIVETLGKALAEQLQVHTVDTIALWSDPHTAALGHVVARELSARLIYAYADQGILTLTAQPNTGDRIAVLDYEWEPFPGLAPLVTMLRTSADVVAVASVLPLPPFVSAADLGDAAVIALDSAPSPSGGDTP